jgi:hypothetical protein
MSKVPTALNIIGESNRVIAHTGLRNNPILGYFLSFFTSFGSMTHVIVLSLSIFFIAPARAGKNKENDRAAGP